jgi:hypothetical protein
MVDLRANSRFRPGLQAAVCIVVLDRPAAWDALAGRDAVHPHAVRFRVLFQEPVRDCPMAADEKELLVVPRAHREPQPQDVQEL